MPTQIMKDKFGVYIRVKSRKIGSVGIKVIVWVCIDKQDSEKHPVTCSATHSDKFNKFLKETLIASYCVYQHNCIYY